MMKRHKCQLPLRLEDNYPFASVKPRTFKNYWIAWFSISRYNPTAARYMFSTAMVAAERKKHINTNWWIIHPFSYGRFVWNLIMLAVYFVAFLTIPFMISYIVMDYDIVRLDKVNIPIYAIYWVDIVFNCFTGYYDVRRRSTELKVGKIFLFYLKKYFIVDVLSSLPYDHLTLQWRRIPGDNPHYIIVLINLFPLLKLFRYYTVNSYIYYLFLHFEIQDFNYVLCTTLLIGLHVVFLAACVCYLVPILVLYFTNVPIAECKQCWMTKLEKKTLELRFMNALMIVIENMLASGYGKFPPETDDVLIVNSALMIIGRIMVCYMLVMFFRMRMGKKTSELKYQDLIGQLAAFTKQKQLLPHMKKRLLAYYYYRFKNSYFEERRILDILTESLRDQTALHSCRRLIENVAIFKNLPKENLQAIVKNLKFELYLPNDVIVKAGTQGDCMYFLSFGTVTVLTPTGKEISHMEDGSHFGEVALLVADQRRVASVIAIDVCEVYRLDRKDFRQCIEVNSELFAEIERIATERVERTIRVEEQHKRFMMRPSYRDITRK